MKYYKIIEDGIITMIGSGCAVYESQTEITAEKHAELSVTIKAKPVDTLESVYRLSAKTEQYEAFARTHEETVQWYVEQVNNVEMTLEEVPDDYRAEVEAQVNLTEPDPEQAVVDSIMQEVSEIGY